MSALSLVMYRREELASVGGDHCAAVLLQAIRYWSSGGAVWVDKTQAEIVTEIDGMFGMNRVAAALKRLVMAGLIERRKNPYQRQVQTYQYRTIPVEAAAPAQKREPDEQKHETAPDNSGVFNPIDDEVQSLNLKTEPNVNLDSSLYESESELDWESESSPCVREGDEPTQDGDDDDCPEAVKAEIAKVKAKIGSDRVREVLARCEGKARSWHYVLKALRNEMQQKRPSPSSAAPLPAAADYAKYATPVDWSYQGWLNSNWAGGAT